VLPVFEEARRLLFYAGAVRGQRIVALRASTAAWCPTSRSCRRSTG
jgi:hypothetical protein